MWMVFFITAKLVSLIIPQKNQMDVDLKYIFKTEVMHFVKW